MDAELNSFTPTFSIIVPVFNAAQFLTACLESILQQDYSSFEILLVNDGSTDESRNICEEFQTKDGRIRCFHQQQKGVSNARNLGLEQARGEWITFVDADDRLMPEALSIYSNAATSTGADIVKCGYVEMREGCSPLSHCIPERLIVRNHDTASMLNKTEDCGYTGFLWNTAFHRSVIQEIRFDETICWLEDHIFSRQCFKQCRTLVLENRVSYEYFIRNRVSLSFVKDPFMMINASYREYLSRINLLQGEDFFTYEKSEQLVYGRILTASRLLKTLPFKQRLSFLKRKWALLGQIRFGRIRYIQTILKLFWNNLLTYAE